MFGSNNDNQGTQPSPVDNTVNPMPTMNDPYAPSSIVPDMNMSIDSPNQAATSSMSSDFSSVPDLTAATPSNQPSPTQVVEQEVASTDLTPNLSPANSSGNDLEDLVLPGEQETVEKMPSFDDNSMKSLDTNSDLDEIKSKALKDITPLLDKLNLPPLEKFKTVMMTIQAGDSKELIPTAYEIAGKIDNESEKAQALLDVINEINYFSNDKK
jgi:hypothetical protein